MRNLPLAVIVTAGILAAAACEQAPDSARPNAQSPPQSQGGQSPQSRQDPAGGQSARPGDLSPGGGEPVQPRPAPGASQNAPGSAAQAPSSQQTPVAATFDAADADKSGTVDRNEASAVPGLSFATADTDRDAALSRQEFMTAMSGARPPG